MVVRFIGSVFVDANTVFRMPEKKLMPMFQTVDCGVKRKKTQFLSPPVNVHLTR